MKTSSLKPRKLAEVAEDYKERVVRLCCICQKPATGWYGANEKGGTCSGKCEREHNKLSRYPGHSEEEFLQRFNLE